MLRKFFSFVLLFVLFFNPLLSFNVLADSTTNKNYRILLEQGNFEITDKNGVVVPISKKSALYAVHKADQSDDAWSITELIYYPAWNALYLKCIKYLETDYCDGWNFKVNNTNQEVGLDSYSLLSQDKVEFYFQPWGDDNVYLTFNIDVYENSSRKRIMQEVVTKEPQKIEFDLQKGIEFLTQNIKKDDKYLNDMYVDWGIIGLASKDKELALQFLNFYKNKNETNEYLTDNIRQSIALLSLNQNPYNFEGKNYIQKILSGFDGEQFGDKYLTNDDIFALIVLQNVGFVYEDKEIKNSIDFIIKNQNSNGSFANSTDVTSAFIQAIFSFQNKSVETKEALEKAKKYLENTQGQNGSWNDSISSTAWVLQALSLFDINIKTKYQNAFEFIAKNQQSDGGLLSQNEKIQNRFWATAYTIPAVLEKRWKDIMTKVSKPEVITTTEKEPDGEVLGEATFKFTKFMKLGSKNDEVSELQKRLIEEGVYTGPITGYFGKLTDKAVREYQAKNPPLKVDGMVGENTRTHLNTY